MYDDLLIATDGSEGTVRAIDHGLAVAELFDARVHALYVVDTHLIASDTEGFAETETIREALRTEGQRATNDVVDRASERDIDGEAVIRESTSPRRAILEYADDAGIDMVVIGTHGRSGISRIVLGSTAESVIRESPVPVLTARTGQDPNGPDYRDLLVPTDGGPESRAAADHALEIAEASDARVHALSVTDTGLSQSPALLSALERIGREAVQDVSVEGARRGVDVTPAVEEGVPHDRILDYAEAEGIDLVAMGTHGRTGLDRFVTRSVAARVVRGADAPVLTVRSDEE